MSGEPHYLSLRDLAYWQSRPQHKSRAGPLPTLGELQRAHPWTWLYCERCQHHAPFAFAAAVIRWGANASSDVLRQRARCTVCGSKGATLQHPSWGGNTIGFAPFPTEQISDG
jgi:hypothetical protein